MTEFIIIVVAILYLFLTALLGFYVAYQKGRSQMEGFIFGLLFGPLGLLIVACLPTGDNPGRPVNRMVRGEDYGRDPATAEPEAVWLPDRVKARKGKGGE